MTARGGPSWAWGRERGQEKEEKREKGEEREKRGSELVPEVGRRGWGGRGRRGWKGRAGEEIERGRERKKAVAGCRSWCRRWVTGAGGVGAGGAGGAELGKREKGEERERG
ncbi:hypothetical protein TIFTF001_022702 [Ficus carica]|uniref:Uncharacterized protein n=1 Tax=Ficus carica TaxID=3494 RepID=A0AA88AZN1_FICCA|nr:hypothetical protein TIFTF001_022702 [Ficus carica]